MAKEMATISLEGPGVKRDLFRSMVLRCRMKVLMVFDGFLMVLEQVLRVKS